MMTFLSIAQDFVHNIDPFIQVDFDDYFCVNIKNKIVYIERVEHLKENRLIQKFIYEKFNIIMNPLLIGLLHEVGHIKTYNEDSFIEKDLICGLINSFGINEQNYETYSYLYFSIPAEFEATKWAVNYYINHKNSCDVFLNKLYGES